MIDEHTREPLMNIVEGSIAAERLVTELETAFTLAGGPPKVLRMDNGPKLISHALQQFCENTRLGLHSAGPPVGQRPYRIVQQPNAQSRAFPARGTSHQGKTDNERARQPLRRDTGCLYATRRELPAFCARSRRDF
jgi:hypothetical protein